MEKEKIPLRRCTGCYKMKEKSSLIRVVKNNEGEIFIDYKYNKQGRGAYVCKNLSCLEKSQKSRGFERSFKCNIKKEIYEDLKNEIETFLGCDNCG